MGQYHHLIAGLPDITLEDSKQAYSVYDFREEVNEVLSHRDKVLLNLFFLKYDNLNLLRWLKDPEAELDQRGALSKENFEEQLSSIQEKKKKKRDPEPEYGQEKKKKPKKVPAYIVEFLKLYQEKLEKESAENQEDQEDSGFAPQLEQFKLEYDEVEKDTQENPNISWEDILSALYYEYAMKKGNGFISRWFEINLNIKNILTAITCRKYGLDKSLYIIGNNDVAKALKTSNAKDYNLGDEIEYLPAVLKLAEETDLVMREKRVDVLKWEWLEYNTIFKVFGIESVFAYLLKIEMIERWTGLDKAVGEHTFRELIKTMKRESNSALEEFKKNNKR